MSRTEPTAPREPTLTVEQRETLYRHYDTWIRASRAGGSQKCHLPVDDDRDTDRPVCGRSPPVDQAEWTRKDPACFPGEWARGRLCADCAEIVANGD